MLCQTISGGRRAGDTPPQTTRPELAGASSTTAMTRVQPPLPPVSLTGRQLTVNPNPALRSTEELHAFIDKWSAARRAALAYWETLPGFREKLTPRVRAIYVSR